jgi:predicted dehydrogenase
MTKINWGIIGCGDVTEIKSGPAFNKVANSSLVAVMRRNGELAQDYARRHHVSAWYDDAQKLIDDPNVNAIYIATPPSSHEEYTLAAMHAGKPVYVEKPMSINLNSAARMMNASQQTGVKLSIAHYRRGQPYFRKIKEMLDDKFIGDVRVAQLKLYKKLMSKSELAMPGNSWRVDPAVSGGGLFHDLAPHQLDLMYYFFGEVDYAKGIAVNQSRRYSADDVVAGNLLFKNGVVCSGLWCFNCDSQPEEDVCEVIGSKGSLSFTFFNEQVISVVKEDVSETISFRPPRHVQMPMIEKVVSYFLGEGQNPCSAMEGVELMRIIDAFTNR